MAMALLSLVVFLRRQKFQTVPVRVEPLAPVAMPMTEPEEPVVPAPPAVVEPARALPLPAPSFVTSPVGGDGLVHARLPSKGVPNSGLVTTNLAAKRRTQAAPPPPTVPQRRLVTPPAVTTRISFDGF